MIQKKKEEGLFLGACCGDLFFLTGGVCKYAMINISYNLNRFDMHRIKNHNKLSTTIQKTKVLEILEAGLAAAMPDNSLKKHVKKNKIILGKKSIKLSNYKNVYLVAFGKAADSMAKIVDSIVDIKKGFIVIPKGATSVIKRRKYQVFNSGHPIPNQVSVNAAKTILKFLQSRCKDEFVIFLVSGGASALLSLPDQITLRDKIRLTRQLIKSRATIDELNCIRKHLSKIKGGKLVENMACDGVSLVMSDVMGNDLSSIASGSVYCDNTTFSDALNIISKYNLRSTIPKMVLQRLSAGSKGKIPETPKKSKIRHYIVSTNNDCLLAMAEKSMKLGLSIKITRCVHGDVRQVASKLCKLIPKKNNSCIIFGGEPTVSVLGKGQGGRNQELVLQILKKLQKTTQKVTIASMGTDGIDGNTLYAGALINNSKINSGLIESYLKNNDSSSFFKKKGGLILTGYTHTNLMDIGVILHH